MAPSNPFFHNAPINKAFKINSTLLYVCMLLDLMFLSAVYFYVKKFNKMFIKSDRVSVAIYMCTCNRFWLIQTSVKGLKAICLKN